MKLVWSGSFSSRVAEDLPRSPGIFLIPEAGDVQVGHGGAVQLVDPGFFLPEVVVVRVLHDVVPVGNGAVQILGVDVGERAEVEIPLIGVVGVEVEMGVLRFCRPAP